MVVQNWFILLVAIIKLFASGWSYWQGQYKVGTVYILVALIDAIMSTVETK